MPVAAYVVAVVAFLQVAPGGVLHILLAHGSVLHAPLEQPKVQGLLVGV
ncbi:MAG: hypothetical protein ABIQ16_23615 [Polyangiaceae bacterium]